MYLGENADFYWYICDFFSVFDAHISEKLEQQIIKLLWQLW